ncbi:MAG: hypothetical protein ACKO9Q_16460, partial [Pirellula sp.]
EYRRSQMTLATIFQKKSFCQENGQFIFKQLKIFSASVDGLIAECLSPANTDTEMLAIAKC